jgi:hypothetical protein
VASHLEQKDLVSEFTGLDGRRQTTPSTAHDGDSLRRTHHLYCPRHCVRVAIQSFRSGVSDVRWCRT